MLTVKDGCLLAAVLHRAVGISQIFKQDHRASFNPEGPFKICFVHFPAACLARGVHIKGATRSYPLYLERIRKRDTIGGTSVRSQRIGYKSEDSFSQVGIERFL